MNDSREFQDVESVCSSTLSHVPTQPVIVSSPCGFPSRDQCQHTKLTRYIRRRLWKFSFTSWTDDIFQKGLLHGKNLISSFDGSVFSRTGKLVARSEEVNKDTIPTPRFARKSSTWNSPSHVDGVHPQNYVVDQNRLQISDLHFVKFQTPSAFSCWKIRFKTEECACSSSPSQAMLWIKEVDMVDSSRILRCWTRRLREPCTRSSRIHTLRRRAAWRSRKVHCKLVSFEDDRLPSWSTSTSEWLALMMLFLTTPIYSVLLFATKMFEIRHDVGRDVVIKEQSSNRSCPRKFAQIMNKWVWSRQNRVGTAWTWYSSKAFEAWLSEVENLGLEKHRAKKSDRETFKPETRGTKHEQL